jgi:hypothetical protein
LSRHLPVKDYQDILSYRKFGILNDVVDHNLQTSNGIVMVVCPDCDRFFDKYNYKASLMNLRGNAEDPRVHPLSTHAGALRLIPPDINLTLDPPLNNPTRTRDLDLIDEIREALALKSIYEVALYMHWPCGKASACNINLGQALEILAASKKRFLESPSEIKVPHFSEVNVVTYCHIDYCQFEEGKKRTYFANVDQLAK